MLLTFVNSEDKERKLGVYSSTAEAEKSIRDFLKDHNFKYYYFNLSIFPTKTVYDVGSWSEFFVLYNKDDVELNKYPIWRDCGETNETNETNV